MNTPVAFEAVVTYNAGTVAQSKDAFFKFEWYVRSGKTGSASIKLGEGRSIEFIPSSYGFDPNYNIGIWCKMYLYSVSQMVMSGTAAVTSESKLVITKKYE